MDYRLLLWMPMFVSATSAANPAFNGDEFSNNLFSDLAPLLALFGEQFAKQYMSQSMSWIDNLIFAIAPLGIITAIVGAIRVGGPSWLKAIIGRAREAHAACEVELMSSTSHEVCELWNGQTVVRVLGSPQVIELIFIEPPNLKTKEEGIFTLEEPGHKLEKVSGDVTGVGPSRKYTAGEDPEQGARKKSSEQSNKNSESEEVPGEASAPNLSLNINRKRNDYELWATVVFGLFIQTTALMIAGLGTYYSTWDFKKGGSVVQGYAYPLILIGTLTLGLGMFICAGVVEKSTGESMWKKRDNTNTKFHFLWIQRHKVVSDQVFQSYAIIPQGPQRYIMTSRRLKYNPANDGDSPWMHKVLDQYSTYRKLSLDLFKIATVFGTLVGVCGFIIQFIGLRGAHWSASIAQLVATFLMTILRAIVRRGVISRPSAERLATDYELDWLSMKLARDWDGFWKYYDGGVSKNLTTTLDSKLRPSEPARQWMNMAANTCCFEDEYPTPEEIQKAVIIRKRLGKLTQWKGPASEPAVCIAGAVEGIMNILFLHSGDIRSFRWTLNTPFGDNIHLEVTRSNRKKWIIDATEIEAVLSLWLHHATQGKSKEKGAPTDEDWLRSGKSSLKLQSLRFLGPNSAKLRRDLQWWTPVGKSTLCEVQEHYLDSGNDDQSAEYSNIFDIRRVIGFSTVECLRPNPDKELPNVIPTKVKCKYSEIALNDWDVHSQSHSSGPLAKISTTSLPHLYAQHIFSGFMWAVSFKTKQLDGHTSANQTDVLNPSTSWKSLKLENATLTKMLQVVKETGLGNLEDAYLSIIPPLSINEKLPLSEAVDLVHKNVRIHEEHGNWKEAGRIYLSLFQFTSSFGYSPLRKKALACMFEFYRLVSVNERFWPSYDSGDLKYIKKQIAEHVEKSLDLKALIESLQKLYQLQGRTEGLEELTQMQPKSTEVSSSTSSAKPTDAALISSSEDDILQEKQKLKLSTKDKENLKKKIELSTEDKGNLRKRDILDWSPLHYAVVHSNKAIDFQTSELGWTETHSSIMRNLNTPYIDPKDVILNCLKHGADPNAKDIVGRTPLHYASLQGKAKVVSILLKHGANVTAQGRDGFTPLHCAALNGHMDVIVVLLRSRAKINIQDNLGRTPLHLAAYRAKTNVVKLLVQKHADISIEDYHDRTALYFAVIGGDPSTTKSLLPASGKRNEADANKSTILHTAAANGHVALLKLFFGLEQPSEFDQLAKNNYGDTALHLAAANGKDSVVELLLNEKPSEISAGTEKIPERLTQNDFGETALHLATREGHVTVVKMILEDYKEDADTKDLDGYTLFLLAALHGHTEILELLLNMAEINYQETDTSGNTALHLAAKKGHIRIVQLLVKNGLDNENLNNDAESAIALAIDSNQREITEYFIDNFDILQNQRVNPWNFTLLMYAAFRGNTEHVRLFIERGADKEIKDLRGRTALILAVKYGNRDVVQILLQYGANLEAKDDNGGTALLVAAQYGYRDVVQILLDDGADRGAKDNNGEAALHMAARSGSQDVVKILLDDGANREAKDFYGSTALILAVEYGNRDVVQILLQYGANLEAKDDNGGTALLLAAQYGYRDVVQILLDGGANREAKDDNGGTALLLAAQYGCRDVVQILLDGGANREAKDDEGRTALLVAAKYGDWDVVQILLDDGANREAKDDEGRTALMLATMKGHLGLVSYLIRNNVDQASKDNQGLTARDHAIAMQKKIVENEKLNSNRSRICELLGAGNENNQVEKLDEENMDDSRRNSTMALRNSQSS